MLKDHFYTHTTPLTSTGTGFRCGIRFNGDHEIFSGHFPGLPVVPGVCMMAIIKDLVETASGKKVVLSGTSQIKFLSLINPKEHPEVDADIRISEGSDGTITADGTISSGEITFFKMSKAVYR